MFGNVVVTVLIVQLEDEAQFIVRGASGDARQHQNQILNRVERERTDE